MDVYKMPLDCDHEKSIGCTQNQKCDVCGRRLTRKEFFILLMLSQLYDKFSPAINDMDKRTSNIICDIVWVTLDNLRNSIFIDMRADIIAKEVSSILPRLKQFGLESFYDDEEDPEEDIEDYSERVKRRKIVAVNRKRKFDQLCE